jgi:hypothetical protein
MNTVLKTAMINPMENISGTAVQKASTERKSVGWQPALLLLFLLSIWFSAQIWMRSIDPLSAITDQSIWLMVILSMVVFLLILALCMWLLDQVLLKTGLPSLLTMLSQFKTMMLWQQLAFYLSFFALLLMAASACLIAIC